MFIKSIRFSNFRSFHNEQKVDFSNKNIIVGKNGAGKSNFLRALSKIFLVSEKKNENDSNEGISTIELDIDNTERRFPLPGHFTIAVCTRNGIDEYEVNKKSCGRDELVSMLENAGLNTTNIVMQGHVTKLGEMNGHERYLMLCEVAGIEKYDRSREEAFRYLNDENEGKIENILLKLEVNTRRTEEMRKKHEEYERILEAKKKVEYKMIVNEIFDLSREIERMEEPENEDEGEINEGLAEYELKECRIKICETRAEAEKLRAYLEKGGREVVEKIEQDIANFKNKKAHNPSTDNTLSDCTELNGNNNNTIETCISPCIANPFHRIVETLEKKRRDLEVEYERIKQEESEMYVEIQAQKYWEASQGKDTDLNTLKIRINATRAEIEASKNRNTNPSNITNGSACNGRPFNDNANTSDSLIIRRKKLWIQEKGLRDEIKNVEEETQGLWKKLLHVGRQSVNIYEEIKGENGVFGMVFELLSVPEEMHAAYEAVGRGGLFWIVVEDEGVASKLVKQISGRATFAALNVINRRAASTGPDKKIDDDRLLRLSDAVRCDAQYRGLAQHLCKDYYVCCDVSNALRLGEQHGVNTVTLDGDVVAKGGAMTGGYEAGCPTVQELLRSRRRETRLRRALTAIKGELDEVAEKLLGVENASDGQRQYENLLAYEKYLIRVINSVCCSSSVDNIKEMGNRRDNKNSTNMLVHRTLQNKLRQIEQHLEQIQTDLERETNRKERHGVLVQKVLAVQKMNDRISDLQRKEKQCIEKLYGQPARQTLALENVSRHVLVDRRSGLMARIGATQLGTLVRAEQTRDELASELRALSRELRLYNGYERIDVLADNYSGLATQLSQLKGAKDKILQFIEHLDSKKKETLRLTFALIAGNYAYFYEQLTGARSELRLRGDVIEVLVDGVATETRLLSGGQKSCVSLALIFAIQKNDPAPFYVFDEVDANLDTGACRALYGLLKTESAQWFVTTFKEDALGCGDRFYGVAVENKSSFMGEIDHALAVETLHV